MTDGMEVTRIPHNLPSLRPIQSILPITPLDRILEQGIEQVLLPPRGLEELSLLFHVGVRQAVYVGTHLLDWLYTNPPGGSSALSPIMVYRHMLDLGDSIGTLLRFQAGQTAFVLLRALFECSFTLDFLLQDDTFHADRAVAYWAGYRIDQWETRVKYDPATPKGKRVHELLDKDPALSTAKFPRKDLSEEREKLEQVLQSSVYKPSWDKYQEVKSKGKTLEWYSLCSEARNLRDLARLVGREAEYEILYGYLSSIAHAGDVFSGLMERDPGEFAMIHQIRGPEQKLVEVATLSANFLLMAHHHVKSTFLTPDHAMARFFNEWYREYRTFYRWQTGKGE